VLQNYYWRGNIRQLKNVAEQISAIEQSRLITADVLRRYLPDSGHSTHLSAGSQHTAGQEFANERELLYKLLFDMRAEIGDLKRMVAELMQRTGGQPMETPRDVKALLPSVMPRYEEPVEVGYAETEEVVEEPRERTKADVQREQILRALRRNNGRRKEAAAELFMSERTLYRKIKELGIEE
jgi:DNA-binding NtrC family response regulator